MYPRRRCFVTRFDSTQVEVTRLYVKGTVEDRILQLQEHKRELASYAPLQLLCCDCVLLSFRPPVLMLP